MKLRFIILSIIGLISLSPIYAQLRVNKSGQIHIGNISGNLQTGPITGLSDIGIGSEDQMAQIDTTSTIAILGYGKNMSKARITFGDNDYVSIGEAWETDNSNLLQLKGYRGIRFKSGENTVFSYARNNSSSKFNFNTDLLVKGISVTSDSRLKENIRPLEMKSAGLFFVTPVSFTYSDAAYRNNSIINDTVSDKEYCDIPEDANVINDKLRFGFLAQDIREIFPELVEEDENGYLNIDYLGFIPLLVDAVKSLNETIEIQRQKIEALCPSDNNFIHNKTTDITRNSLPTSEAILMQNRPNPFSNSTVIECVLPEIIKEAYLYIYDMQGKQMMCHKISERGKTNVTIEASTLQPGMYLYSLITDGKEIDCRRMIITD